MNKILCEKFPKISLMHGVLLSMFMHAYQIPLLKVLIDIIIHTNTLHFKVPNIACHNISE